MSRVLPLVALTCFAAALAAHTSAAALPTLLGSNDRVRSGFVARPTEIVYAGDGTGILGGLHRGPRDFGRLSWSSWTRARAVGSGSDWLDDCKPDCARGRFFPVRITVVASRVVGGHFTRLAIRGKGDTKCWSLGATSYHPGCA